MKFIYLALPLLGSLAIAQSLVEDDCQCPQVKCPDTDTFEGCICVNLAELSCKIRCPNYTPTRFMICPLPQQPSTVPVSSTPTATALVTPNLPILGFPTPALPLPKPALPSSLADLPDLPLIPGCECEEMFCIQSFPESCHCAYNIAKTCWDKCGGKSPGLNTCPPLNPLGGGFNFDGPVKRAAAPEPLPAQKSTVPIPVNIPVDVPALVSALIAPLSTGTAKPQKCTCEPKMCIQMYPASCICANSNKYACWKKCGGVKPAYQACTNPFPAPLTSKRPSATPTRSLVTSTRVRTTSTPKPSSTAASGRTQICGGGRANTNNCATGYTCMDDPFRVGVDGYCGLACDQTGICVKDGLCGGFAGFQCSTPGQVCVDDPRDDCSAKTGGADCGGVCVWPLRSRQLYTASRGV